MRRSNNCQCWRRHMLVSGCLATLPILAVAESLQQVTVTAQKRDQDLAKTGLTVTVLTASDTKSLRIRAADDIAQLEPNVSLNKPFGNANPVIVIRGVGLQDYNVNNSPNIGMYVDESYLASNALADFAVFDMERIEILKGPQGALWGHNATGGAVSFVTRKPQPAFESDIVVGAADHQTTNLSGMINLPANESVLWRASGVVENRSEGRYFSRTLNHEYGQYRRGAARVALTWTPTARVRVDTRLDGGHYTGDSTPFVHVGLVGPSCPIANSSPATGVADEVHCTNTTTGYSDPDDSIDIGDWNIVPQARRSTINGAVRIAYDLERSTITSLSSWTQLHYSRGEDDDTSSLPLLQIDYHTHLESISEELRWTSRTADSKTWLLGVQASLDRDREHRIASLAGLFGNLFDSATLHYAQSVRSAAVFGQLEQRLADRTRLTLAARYTQDELQFNGGAMAGPGPFVPGFVAQVFPGLPSTVNLDRSFHDLSGRIAITVQPNESLLVYGSLSKGYKPGGIFGGFGLAREAFTPYAPERLYAAEVGLRWQAFHSVLTGTASIFRYNYQDIQAQTLIQAATGSIPLLANVGDASVAGAEFSARWQVTPHLKFDVGAGLLETELQDSVIVLDSLQRTLNLKGHELPQAPRWSARTAIRYVPAIALDGWILALQADAFFRGPYWNDIPNQVHLRQSRPVSLYGASIELGSSNDRWALQLWGRNLANDRYLTHGNSSGIGNDLLMYSEGRGYGLSVNCHWK